VVLALFLCALFSKTVTCSLPAALALLIWWKAGRVEKRDALALAPLFVLGAGLGFTTAWMEKYHVGAAGQEWALSFVQRGLLAGRALWFYAGKLFWPSRLAFVYPRWEIDSRQPWQYLFPLAALVVLSVLWLLRKRIGKGPLVAVLYFAGTLTPALGLADVYPFRFSFVADHFQYLACIGLIALAVGTGATISGRAGQHGRGLGTLVAAGIALVLGTATWGQAHVYQDQETLWRDTLAENPRAWIAHSNLGMMLFRQGRVADAMEHFEQALRLNPLCVEARNNMGVVLAQAGKIQDAIEYYEEALRIAPDYAEAHNNLGIALASLGRVEEAVAHYEQALRLNAGYANAHYNLGLALVRLAGRTKQSNIGRRRCGSIPVSPQRRISWRGCRSPGRW
jgi:tetratricopeptide (TPR) repeat protein